MSPRDAREAPGKGPLLNTLDFGSDYTLAPGHRDALDHLPRCWVCGKAPALYEGRDGRNVHKICEPADVGMDDPATSHRADKSARKGSRSLLGRAILEELQRRADGATDDELRTVFEEAPPGSVSKRRGDLCRDGLARDSGRTRRTRFGKDAIVWVAT